MHLKDILMEDRIKYGFKHWEVAKALGVSSTSYCKWEKGTTIPNAGNMRRIAEYLDITFEQLQAILGENNEE